MLYLYCCIHNIDIPYIFSFFHLFSFFSLFLSSIWYSYLLINISYSLQIECPMIKMKEAIWFVFFSGKKREAKAGERELNNHLNTIIIQRYNILIY